MTIRETSWPSGTPCWVDIAVPDVPAATCSIGWCSAGRSWTPARSSGTTRSAGPSGRPRRRSARGATDQPSAWTVYLASDDADSTAKLIVENGGSLLVEPTDIGDNGRMCVAIDTSGGMFGVWQAIETIGLEITDEPGSLVWTDARLTDPVAGKDVLRRGVRLPLPAGPRRARRLRHVPGRRTGWPAGMGGMLGAAGGAGALAGLLRGGRRRRHRGRRADGGRHGRGKPQDTPFGRTALLVDPFGATFGVHGPLAAR